MIDIIFEPDNYRSTAYDGDINIGECTYIDNNELWIINHTFVDPNYGGQGIAKKLVATLVDNARKHNRKIEPVCPFAAAEFRKNSDYRDILAS